MFDRDEVLSLVVPHRLNSVAALRLALKLSARWRGGQKPMKIYFSEQLQITGSSNAFINPVVEAGIIHCRALLDFLGLCVSRDDARKLANRGPKSKPDDWVIEDFANSAGPLPLVTPQQAIARYQGNPGDAEAALASVLHTANKGLAHITSGLVVDATDASGLEIASRGVEALVISHLYTPLGLPPPKPSISRSACDEV